MDGESLAIVRDYVAQGGARYRQAVDIATGPGFTAFATAPFADRVLATDITPQMLAQARRIAGERALANVALALAQAEHLPFADGSLDLITCRTAPHHFRDVDAWLRECARSLRPDGVFVMADTCAPEDPALAAWMNDLEVRRDPSHVRNLPASEWLARIRAAGLGVTDRASCHVYLSMPDWAQRAAVNKAETAGLASAFLAAPPAAKARFGITPHADGTLTFHWDCVVVRATKARFDPS